MKHSKTLLSIYEKNEKDLKRFKKCMKKLYKNAIVNLRDEKDTDVFLVKWYALDKIRQIRYVLKNIKKFDDRMIDITMKHIRTTLKTLDNQLPQYIINWLFDCSKKEKMKILNI